MKHLQLLIPKSKDCFILLEDGYITSNHRELNEYVKHSNVAKTNSQVLINSTFGELSNMNYQEFKERDKKAREELQILELNKGKVKLPRDTIIRFNTDICSIDILASSIFIRQIKTVRISIDDLNTFIVDRYEYKVKEKAAPIFDISWQYSENDVKKTQLVNHDNTRLLGFPKETTNLDDKNFILTFEIGQVQFSYDFKTKNIKKYDNGDFFNLSMKDWVIRANGGNHFGIQIARINLICKCESFTVEIEKFGQIERIAVIKVNEINYDVLALPIQDKKMQIDTRRFKDKMIGIGVTKSRNKVRDLLKKHFSSLIDDSSK